jgi:hypothetical protein
VLHVLLLLDGVANILEESEPNEALEAVAFGEALDRPFPGSQTRRDKSAVTPT